jgi:UDP-N-acetylmuramate--alanine ligase
MTTHIFMEAQRDPTVMIGGYLPLLNAGHRVGAGDTVIMESCEYCDSFLNFYPTVAVINNIEADHLDYFKDLDAVKASFRRFAALVPRMGFVLANGDDENTMDALKNLNFITFGVGRKHNIYATNLSEDCRCFDIVAYGKPYCHVEMQVNGMHNIYNALAAASSAYVMGIDGEAVSRGLAGFNGAGRRMEYKGRFHGADIYDDYAHHPGELRALIDSVKLKGYERIVLAFQPHTYTRTKALFADFVEELKRVDVPVLAEIYAAREQNTVGISSAHLAQEVPGAEFFETLPEVTAYLRGIAREGDIILTVGAGDIYKAGEELLK